MINHPTQCSFSGNAVAIEAASCLAACGCPATCSQRNIFFLPLLLRQPESTTELNHVMLPPVEKAQ